MANTDPGAFFREMLGQWEGIANQFGAEMMKSGEFARTVHGATSAGLRAKEAAKEAMSRALEAANMPSREEITGLAERMRAVEERLGRIETLLIRIAGEAIPAPPAPPHPARTKKPPKKSG